jgi:hypothetical protein
MSWLLNIPMIGIFACFENHTQKGAKGDDAPLSTYINGMKLAIRD